MLITELTLRKELTMGMDLNFFEALFDRRLAEKVGNINELEEAIYRLVMELGRNGIEEVLEGADEKLLAECPRCGGSNTESKGKEGRLLKTRLGEVRIRRRRLYCRNCQKSFYPLDEKMGISSGEKRHFELAEAGSLLWSLLAL